MVTVAFILVMYYYLNSSKVRHTPQKPQLQHHEPSQAWPPKFGKNLIEDSDESAQPPQFGIDNEVGGIYILHVNSPSTTVPIVVNKS